MFYFNKSLLYHMEVGCILEMFRYGELINDIFSDSRSIAESLVRDFLLEFHCI